MIRSFLILATLGLGTPAIAQGSPETFGSVQWIRDNSELPLTFRDVGHMTIASGGVVAADPLTFGPGMSWPYTPVPAGPARLIIAFDTEFDLPSKAMIVFADGPVACGNDVATTGTDTGLVTFLDQPRTKALFAAGDFQDTGKNLYDDWFYSILPDIAADQFPLPSGTTIPIITSGFGDGTFPVATLVSSKGSILALYVDFMGKDADGNWLLPPPCDPA